jgi:[ribosomal protein S5]-alanine N-acetyltransferase
MFSLTLSVEGCTVRPWRHDDAESLAKHANNRLIWLNLRDAFPHPYSLSNAESFLTAVVGESPELHFCIACRDAAIGGISLRPGTDVERFSAELGYWLGEEFWRQGIATSAIRVITRYGLDSLKLQRIFALPFSRNTPSMRALEKAGYIFEGRLRKSAFKDGRFEDQLMYAFTSHD